ncbi:hypothetical protein SLS62_005114 [Diatrype stigma]|uniref:Succinate dehydrogenase assembly factor 4, mitochondrial n=1 Tax=Diatrype stigma TaxID=117547 RepID=A0AAN9UQ79_9PEZI
MIPTTRALYRTATATIAQSPRRHQRILLPHILPQPTTNFAAAINVADPHHQSGRRLSSTSPFPGGGPAPPRLPPEEQAEFERLQRLANTQEGFNPTSTPASLYDPVHELAPAPAADHPVAVPGGGIKSSSRVEEEIKVGEEEEAAHLSQPLRKGAPPEFEGDVNPKTGEVGGPKNEPLRWGAGGDYSYNGRVTDF